MLQLLALQKCSFWKIIKPASSQLSVSVIPGHGSAHMQISHVIIGTRSWASLKSATKPLSLPIWPFEQLQNTRYRRYQ